MIYVGIDIGKTRHGAAAIDERGRIVLKPIVVVQDSAGFTAFHERLLTLGEQAEIMIGIEASGHYWKLLWQFLLTRGWQIEVLDPVLSASTARHHLRGGKTDADDAVSIAKTLRDRPRLFHQGCRRPLPCGESIATRTPRPARQGRCSDAARATCTPATSRPCGPFGGAEKADRSTTGPRG